METQTLSGALRRRGLKHLLYLCHPANLESILRNGILSYNSIRRRRIPHQSIANVGVQWRRNRTEFSRSIHDNVPLYLARRNPMLWAVKSHPRVYVRVRLEVADKPGTIFSDGNAASGSTRFFQHLADVDKIPWDVVFAKKWTGRNFPDGTRQRCAEVLVPDCVEPEFITEVRCDQSQKVLLPADLRCHLLTDPLFVSTDFYYGYD